MAIDSAEVVAGVVGVATILAGIGRAIQQARKPAPEPEAATEDRAKLDNAALWVLLDSVRATNAQQQTELAAAHGTIKELRDYLDQANRRNDRIEGRMTRLQAELDKLKG